MRKIILASLFSITSLLSYAGRGEHGALDEVYGGSSNSWLTYLLIFAGIIAYLIFSKDDGKS